MQVKWIQGYVQEWVQSRSICHVDVLDGAFVLWSDMLGSQEALWEVRLEYNLGVVTATSSVRSIVRHLAITHRGTQNIPPDLPTWGQCTSGRRCSIWVWRYRQDRLSSPILNRMDEKRRRHSKSDSPIPSPRGSPRQKAHTIVHRLVMFVGSIARCQGCLTDDSRDVLVEHLCIICPHRVDAVPHERDQLTGVTISCMR